MHSNESLQREIKMTLTTLKIQIRKLFYSFFSEQHVKLIGLKVDRYFQWQNEIIDLFCEHLQQPNSEHLKTKIIKESGMAKQYVILHTFAEWLMKPYSFDIILCTFINQKRTADQQLLQESAQFSQDQQQIKGFPKINNSNIVQFSDQKQKVNQLRQKIFQPIIFREKIDLSINQKVKNISENFQNIRNEIVLNTTFTQKKKEKRGRKKKAQKEKQINEPLFSKKQMFHKQIQSSVKQKLYKKIKPNQKQKLNKLIKNASNQTVQEIKVSCKKNESAVQFPTFLTRIYQPDIIDLLESSEEEIKKKKSILRQHKQSLEDMVSHLRNQSNQSFYDYRRISTEFVSPKIVKLLSVVEPKDQKKCLMGFLSQHPEEMQNIQMLIFAQNEQ